MVVSLEPCPICGGSPSTHLRAERAGQVAVCGQCGSWYRVPRPRREELARIYDKDYYRSWGQNENEAIATITKRATFTPLLKRLEKRASWPSNVQISLLDVGAATGLLMETAQALGWSVWGVELNPYSAGVLREKFGSECVFEGELPDCPFEPASFHMITMTDLIEHVLDVDQTLRAAGRLLRPGGLLGITTPRIDSWSRSLMGSRWLHFKEEHIQYFSRNGIGLSLKKTGFTDLRARSHTKHLTLDYLDAQFRAYPHWLLSPSVAWLRKMAPAILRRRAVGFRCGEMLVIARRPVAS